MFPHPSDGPSMSVVVETGNIYAGLYYPIGVVVMSLIIGGLFIKESKDHHLE